VEAADWLGWAASVVLLAILSRRVYVRWRENSSDGVSSLLHIGQVMASAGFVIYSWMVGNRLFVVTSSAVLVTAVLGQWVQLRNARYEADKRLPLPDHLRSHRRSPCAPAQGAVP
jgi:MtN3 and saliva related transmembrane protein